MRNYNLLQISIAVLLSISPTANAKKLTDTDCGGTCTFEYDTETDVLTFSGTGVITSNWHDKIRYWDDIPNHVLNNVVIGEGITGAEGHAFSSPWHTTIGSSDGYIKIPSTFNNQGVYDNDYTFYYAGFGTFEIAPTNSDVPTSLGIALPNAHTLILTADENLSLVQARPSRWSTGVDVQCRGGKSICEKMVRGMDASNNLSYSYYSGPDGNGNWEVWSDEGKAVYADSTLQKILGKYNFAGNQTASYKYDGAGNLTAAYENGVATFRRTSYTPAEAAAAVKKGNKNKVTMTFK